MRKILYFILLAAELFFGACLMLALCNNSLYIPVVIASVALVTLVIWQIVLLRKATDGVAKRRIMTTIALIMLTPVAVFFVTYAFIAVVMTIAFI